MDRRRTRRIVTRLAGLAVIAAVTVMVVRWRRPDPMSLELIKQAIAAGRWSDVESGLSARVAARPDDGESRLMLGLYRMDQGRLPEAIELLTGVPADDPRRARAQTTLGELALRDHRAADAEAAFRDAVSHDPGALEPRRRLVWLLSLQQRTADARAMLWQMHDRSRDPRLLLDLVLALWATEVDTRAMGTELDALLSRTPEDPFLRRARGLELQQLGRPDEALQHLEAAAARLTDDPLGRFALAECRLASGGKPPGVEILGARPIDPAEAARWLTLRARLQDLAGEQDKALLSLSEACQTNRSDPEAQHRLGQALAANGDATGARIHRAQAESIRALHARVRREHTNLRRQGFAADAALFERMGELCQEAGLNAEARAWFENALQVETGRDSVRSRLAALGPGPDRLPIALVRPRLVTGVQPGELAGVTAAPVARPTTGAPPRFVDMARSASLDFTYQSGARGDLFLADTMGGGVILLDYDQDGWLDLYAVNGCPLPVDPTAPPAPNRLYRNRGDGTFVDRTEAARVGGRGYGMGGAVGDYDADGWPDLFVTGLEGTVLYRNRGDGTFEDVTLAAGVGSDRWSTAAAFADLDADGDQDLVVVTYVAANPQTAPACRDHSGGRIHCSPGLFPAQDDHLFRNNGDGTFTDIAREAGLTGRDGRGLGLAIVDLDDDGRLDLFVANDASADFAYRNLGDLRFIEVAHELGLALNGAGKATASMGVVADDLDGDGHLDLFITNFLNEPNSFFRGLGQGLYADQGSAAGLSAPSIPMTGFGTAALDADNDGDLDLFVANGHVDDQPWINSPMKQPQHLFLNQGGGRFTLDQPMANSALAPTTGRGVAAGDFDNDGRVDLVVVQRDGPLRLLQSQGPAGHWLALNLQDRSGASPAVGARVTVTAGGRRTTRWVTAGTSYLSGHEERIHFGLGSNESIDAVEIRWPSGRVEHWTDLAIDRLHRLRESVRP